LPGEKPDKNITKGLQKPLFCFAANQSFFNFVFNTQHLRGAQPLPVGLRKYPHYLIRVIPAKGTGATAK
jgi:hypothetical protein